MLFIGLHLTATLTHSESDDCFFSSAMLSVSQANLFPNLLVTLSFSVRSMCMLINLLRRCRQDINLRHRTLLNGKIKAVKFPMGSPYLQ